MKPLQSRAPRSKTPRSWLRRLLPYAAPISVTLAIAVVTGVYYVAIRTHSVELSFDQLSAFERQVSNLGNSSLYLIEPPRRDEVMDSLSTEDWAKVSASIDLVAFIYDDPVSFVNTAWLAKVNHAFKSMPFSGYGIVLFPCGCVIPNTVFVNTQVRFNGAECTMLPGFVIQNDFVAFIDTDSAKNPCRNRDIVLRSNWYETHSWKLDQAKREHNAFFQKLSGGTTSAAR